MTRQWILFTGIMILLANCSSTVPRGDLTVEEEDRLALDMDDCNKQADETSRGFGKGSITWERTRQEIYDYCLREKGWDLK